MGSERFEAPECMFQPHLVDVDQPGVAGTRVADSFAATGSIGLVSRL